MTASCFYDDSFTELVNIMRTEHYLFLVLRITPKSMANFWAQWRMSLCPPVAATGRSKAGIWCHFYFMLFGEGVSCRIWYSVVGCLCLGCSGSITSVWEERANLSAIVCLWLCGFCSRVGSSSSRCLKWAAFFYCGTHWAFYIII